MVFNHYILMEMAANRRKDFAMQAAIERMHHTRPGFKYQVFARLSSFFLWIGEELQAQAISAHPGQIQRRLEEIKDLR